MGGVGMRAKDARIFSIYAREQKLYLLVRHTNPDSLKYVGVNGYVPKPFYIKAKTAKSDVPKCELKGLVIDPRVHPTVIGGARYAAAEKATLEDLAHIRGGKAAGVEVRTDMDAGSRHFGCIQIRCAGRYDWSYVHGDYDLKDIIEEGHESRNVARSGKEWGIKHATVQLVRSSLMGVLFDLNRAMGVAMIQHGAEAQYAGHSNDDITGFFPDGGHMLYLNGAVQAFYQQAGRSVHGKSSYQPSPTIHLGPPAARV